jgi:hypothetical protein
VGDLRGSLAGSLTAGQVLRLDAAKPREYRSALQALRLGRQRVLGGQLHDVQPTDHPNAEDLTEPALVRAEALAATSALVRLPETVVVDHRDHDGIRVAPRRLR